ncbi:Acetolactate synthase [Heracleum sosnowskyi]|uniref:Acetolactate synthase n=1 Tax=Heracleum sosnowskyi TaxID=360622 RepID=A0AAD8HB56_9APIA|nr:Acetolactate synthase [Heracleum sosnowskyi]
MAATNAKPSIKTPPPTLFSSNSWKPFPRFTIAFRISTGFRSNTLCLANVNAEIHQALTRCYKIKNILPRHEQGGIFAAEGYARATGRPGVCIATSGPGATNLISGIADAFLDSTPIVAITGQVPKTMIGTNAFC